MKTNHLLFWGILFIFSITNTQLTQAKTAIQTRNSQQNKHLLNLIRRQNLSVTANPFAISQNAIITYPSYTISPNVSYPLPPFSNPPANDYGRLTFDLAKSSYAIISTIFGQNNAYLQLGHQAGFDFRRGTVVSIERPETSSIDPSTGQMGTGTRTIGRAVIVLRARNNISIGKIILGQGIKTGYFVKIIQQ
jgi:hypothetical protein